MKTVIVIFSHSLKSVKSATLGSDHKGDCHSPRRHCSIGEIGNCDKVVTRSTLSTPTISLSHRRHTTKYYCISRVESDADRQKVTLKSPH